SCQTSSEGQMIPTDIETKTHVMLADIMMEVAKKHALAVWDLRAKSRSPSVLKARHEFYYRALKETEKSCPTIGHYTNADHGAVLYGAAKHAVVNNLPMPRGGVACLQRVIHMRPDYQFN